jgi:hypothetical protein
MRERRAPFNQPQMTVVLNKPRGGKNIWSRASGKTFIIAWIIHIIVKNMPRASWGIVGKSYKQILTRTLPSTLNALENDFGYVKGIDFVVNQKPPKGWDRPLYELQDYSNSMVFRNGCCFPFGSLDGGGSSFRGPSIDGYLGDEALELDKAKIDDEVSPANRGQKRYFGHVPWHHGSFFFSSMGYGSEFRWMLEGGDYYLEDGFNYRAIREEIVKLELDLVDTPDKARMPILWTQITDLKKKIKWYKDKNGFLYTEADVFDNLQNLGWDYIKEQRSTLTELTFLVEMLNWLPDAIEDGFYANLDRKYHGYSNRFDNTFLENQELDSEALKHPDCRMDADLIKGQTLHLSVDWGAKINSLTVCQYVRSINTLRFLKNQYVKNQILDVLAKQFCEYYKPHYPKDVILNYGHDGNTKMANSELTYAQQFANILTTNGWTVTMSTDAVPMSQMDRYLLWNRVLKNTIDAKKGKAVDPTLPLVEFNLDNCNETFVSMKNAPAKEGPTGIEKNKKSERNPMIPQEEATHLSDTADYQLTAIVKDPFNLMPGYIGI